MALKYAGQHLNGMDAPDIKYVEHPFLKKNAVERRMYQELLVAQIEEKGNTLVVAPTALGKTVIAAMVIANLVQKNHEKKILFMAPTKPLVVQHQKRMQEFLNIEEEQIVALTGTLSPEKRKKMWDQSLIIAATPQTIENDILTGRLNLNDVQLLIFDEAHRAVKEYSYVFIAQKYFSKPEGKQILALTASPGSTEEGVQDICKNLFIQHISVKTPNDPDVKPYVNPIHVEWKKVSLPPAYGEIKKHLQSFLSEQIQFFRKLGYGMGLQASYLKRTDLIALQTRLREDMMKYGPTKPALYQAVSRAAAVLKVSHAITLLESQGIDSFQEFFDKMIAANDKQGATKAGKLVLEHPFIQKGMRIAQELHAQGEEHPKMAVLNQIVGKQLLENPRSRILVFNHYRDSISHVTSVLNQTPGIRAARFIGQATRSEKDKGLSQKEQINLIREFEEGLYNVLVASSVAEEGLDIPSVDLVIFYEPVPSEIRLIQRRGRTGRKEAGRVMILMAEKTMDEAMYWVSKRKEKNMHDTLNRISAHSTAPKGNPYDVFPKSKDEQATLFSFGEKQEKIFIFVDTREQASSVVKELSMYEDATVFMKQMEVGDFVVGPDIVIERKTTEDFLSSMVDGRLSQQLFSMSESYARPLVILEGNVSDLFTTRNIHANAIRGMLSTIAVIYRIPILYSSGPEETAKYVYLIAKREQLGKDKEIRLRMGRKGLTTSEQQQFITEGLPSIGPTAAKTLLEHFGSIQNIVNATKEELQKVDNIGPKKAAGIRQIIQAPYDPTPTKKKKNSVIPEELEKNNHSSMNDVLPAPIENEMDIPFD